MAFEILIEAASVVYVLAGENRYPQAEPDKIDFDILAQGISEEGVISGAAVTPQGIPDTTVAVAGATIRIAGTDIAYAGGNVNCGAAHAALPRFDLIAINNAGVASAVAGIAAAVPVFPAIPANSIIVAAVWRAANDNTITAADIVDKRVDLLSNSLGVAPTLIPIDGAGIADPDRSHHTLSANAGVADDLNGMTASSIISNGEIVIIRPDAGDTITVKHNALGGADARNILCIGNADIVLDDDHDFAICIYSTAIGAGSWMVLGGGAAGGGAPVNAPYITYGQDAGLGNEFSVKSTDLAQDFDGADVIFGWSEFNIPLVPRLFVVRDTFLGSVCIDVIQGDDLTPPLRPILRGYHSAAGVADPTPKIQLDWQGDIGRLLFGTGVGAPTPTAGIEYKANAIIGIIGQAGTKALEIPGGGSVPAPGVTGTRVYNMTVTAQARLAYVASDGLRFGPLGMWNAITYNQRSQVGLWHAPHALQGLYGGWGLLGGMTEIGTVTYTIGTDGRLVTTTTTAVLGNEAGLHSGGAVARRFNAPALQVKFRVPNIANVRMFIGLSDQTLATMVSSDDPAGNYMGIQFSTDRLYDSGDGANCTTTTGPPGTLTDTDEAWALNEHAGRTVTCNGKTMVIASNTAQTLTGVGGWSGGGNPGDGFPWTITGDVNWQFVVKNNVIQEVIDTGIPATTGVWWIRAESLGIAVRFELLDSTYTVVASATANPIYMPTAAADMRFIAAIENRIAATRSLEHYYSGLAVSAV